MPQSARRVRLCFWVADVQALYQEYSRAGAKITQEPHVQPYGIRDFHLRDPNGLVLICGQDVD